MVIALVELNEVYNFALQGINTGGSKASEKKAMNESTEESKSKGSMSSSLEFVAATSAVCVCVLMTRLGSGLISQY